MKSFITRLVQLGIGCLFFAPAYADPHAILSGPTYVQPGEVATYYIDSWPVPLNNLANVNWNVYGGTVIYSDRYSCQVVWSSTPLNGDVYVSEDLVGMDGDLAVQVGDPTITVSPDYQLVDYGGPAQDLYAVFSTPGFILEQWQGSPDGVNGWTDIPGAIYGMYTPPTTQSYYYRCVGSVNGFACTSNTALVSLAPLDAGSISLTQQPAYNGLPVIANIPAHGGMCYPANLAYTWEASVDGQPWVAIGTGVNYPSGALITGKTFVHRVVSCAGATATSNSLYLVPAYTSVDQENMNYVRTIDVHIAGISTWYQADQLTMDSKTQSTTYLDGLGRAIQQVGKAASYSGGAWIDMVKPFQYDEAGRTINHYLPYPTADNPGKYKSTNVLTDQAIFVTNKYGEPGGAPTYSRVQYDNSPLNRVIATFAAGQAYGGSNRGESTSFDFNTADEMVHTWNLSYSVNAIPSTSPSAIYPTGSLYKLVTTDEKGLQVVTYKDFSGNMVLKKVQELDAGNGLSNQHAGWACTYYVYDDLDHLRFLITPKTVAWLDNNSWALTQQLVNDLCFVYEYDAKGRTISQKQPGAGEMDIIYDQHHRPVFARDANGKVKNQWKGTFYDGLGRVVTTGVLQQSISPGDLQSFVDANTGNVTITRTTTLPGQADPTFDTRQTGRTSYVASHSITFIATATTSFVTEPGASFVAYIDPNLGNTIDEVVAIADNPNPSPANFIALTQAYYDDYSHATKQYTTADNALFDPATASHAQTLPATPDPQTRGMLITSKVKVIADPSDLTQGSWMETDRYFDDQGRVIQTQSDNALGGNDVVTNRYDFQGKLWGSCVKHMAGSPSQFTIVSKNDYDTRGRLIDLAKNFNSTFFKDLASYTYDEYGALVNKRLAPGYNPPNTSKTEMESLHYDYNIQGSLTGINKDYALSTNTYDQWNQFFGIYLGYDNRDNQFAAGQFNGSITGAIWKSQGDNSMRKYDYTYDNLGRLSSGLFQQRKTPADGWSNGAVDLSEYVTYADANGNIGTMKRMGIVPGTAGGVVVDDLLYTYGTSSNPNTNQLSRVDERASFTGNGQLYDFKDGSNSAGANDYTYDENGNLVQDLNKNVTDGATGGVVYNYMNKPVKITIAGKRIIQYTYDATGAKLTKTVTDLTVSPNTSTTTSYADEFVYQDNILQFVLFDEGRLKIITPVNTAQMILDAGTGGANNVLTGGKNGVFEYFIKDQLSNTRMVLTEELQKEIYMAKMETANASAATDEAKLFGKVDPATGNPAPDNELDLSRVDRPTALWTGNTSNKVARLSATGQKVGPNLILKVSAGDLVTAQSDYFYYLNNPAGASTGVSDVLTSLVGALLGNKASSLTKMNSGLINNSLGAAGSDFTSFINNQPNTGPNLNAPNASLSVAFFDEQFNFIAGDPNAPSVGSTSQRVSSANDQAASLLLQQKAPKNGWVFIYLSNESNQDVYFDNLTVAQDHGRISEENHYYAFGQKIAGLCTTAFKKLPNKYNYQGDFSEEEENTGWDEFDLRMYDPQIGRWTGVDPEDQFASPYIGMGNDPVNTIDEDGGWGDGLAGAAIAGLTAGAISYLATKNNGGSDLEALLAGIGGGLAGASIGFATEKVIRGDGHFLGQIRSFYKGFFGGSGDVKAGFLAPSSLRNGTTIPVPDVWKELKPLFGPDFVLKPKWATSFYFSTRDSYLKFKTTALLNGVLINRTIYNVPAVDVDIQRFLNNFPGTPFVRQVTTRRPGLNVNSVSIDVNGIVQARGTGGGIPVIPATFLTIDPAVGNLNTAPNGQQLTPNQIDSRLGRRDPRGHVRDRARLPFRRRVWKFFGIKIPIGRWERNF